MRNQTAQAVWAELDGIKNPLMTRVENYASLTIPKVCLPIGFQPETTDQTHDYQSIGAQCVNQVVNKLMIAMFAPSRPFFRVAPDKSMKAQLDKLGVDEATLGTTLASIEREAIAELDARAQRPKLYQCMRHLVVAGNVLLCLDKVQFRIISLRNYCVKRCADGRLHTLIIRECVKYDELDQAVKDATAGRYQDASEVDHYKLIRMNAAGDYELTQWINGDQLPAKFGGKYPANKLPYLPLVWDLADESDYGTGLVEEYAGDFETLSILSEAIVDGGVLSSEMRWLVNPAGMTSADDLNRSKNGDALPGTKDDISTVNAGIGQGLQIVQGIIDKYESRVSRGFLLLSAVTRDAERVTAEEVRQTAQELETSFGGVYSTLAPTIQLPIANWLLEAVDAKIAGTQLKIVVITGLDALSRNGDLDNLRQCFADLAGTMNLPPDAQSRIKFDKIAAFIGQGRGIDFGQFFMNDQEYSQVQQAQAQQRVAEQSATAAGEAQGQAQAQPQGT